MRISQLIKHLEIIKKMHGDTDFSVSVFIMPGVYAIKNHPIDDVDLETDTKPLPSLCFMEYPF